MRRAFGAGLVVIGLVSTLQAQTQNQPAAQVAPLAVEKAAILTLDQEQIFTGTKFGRVVTQMFEADSEQLKSENRKIDSELEAEERELTERRALMTPATFRPLADAFDKKVEELRTTQDAKSRALSRRRDDDRQRFFQTIAPILGDYMVQRGAVAIVDKSAIVVSLGSIDITEALIAKIDAVLGDGTASLQPAPLQPAPLQPAPEQPTPAPVPAPTP